MEKRYDPVGKKVPNGKTDYINKNTTIKTSDLFNRTDSYILSARKYYLNRGEKIPTVHFRIATLQMMPHLMKISPSRRTDRGFSDIQYRGFIEGFYGGWDYKSQESLMRFARDVKMNSIFMHQKQSLSYIKMGELYPQKRNRSDTKTCKSR